MRIKCLLVLFIGYDYIFEDREELELFNSILFTICTSNFSIERLDRGYMTLRRF